jgi:hypothetical protein
LVNKAEQLLSPVPFHWENGGVISMAPRLQKALKIDFSGTFELHLDVGMLLVSTV